MNIVLMAGGAGTRLWPLSRTHNPKQFLKLDGQTTLLELTYQRARALTEPAHIYVATLKEFGDRIHTLLPEIPLENIFYETERRDTGPAFAAVAARLTLAGHGQEPTTFLWSDHVFTQPDQFIEDVKKIPQLLSDNPESIVIAGHVPTFPETGFGYIEVGEPVAGFTDVFTVKSFKEKPDLATAQQYLEAGKYFWNMGAISARPEYFLAELEKYEPELIAAIEQFKAALVKGDEEAAATAYGQLPKIAIDYALLERTPRIFVVTGQYGWSDVGNWAAVRDIFGTSGDHVPAGHHVHVDAQDNFVYNTTSKAVSLIDVQDVIVVVMDDAVLVTNRNSSHKVKQVVTRLEDDGKDTYL